jgi:NAD(P)-dependent dehydrogenase (short-subunit alcohol dehydrogenase family)
MADLSDPSSIRRAAVEFRKTHKGLDGLVNAAGAIFFNRQTTAFGVDQTWAVNYLGHYLLTVEVLDLLQNRPEARVVTVGGNPAFLKRLALDLDDPSPRDPMAAAGQAMAARVVFALTLARRLRGTGVTSVAFHPGMVRSKLGRHSSWIWRLFGGAMNLWARKDCPIAVDLASSPKFEGQTGCFFDGRGRKVAFPQLEEESLGDNLWKLSQQQSGVEIEKP